MDKTEYQIKLDEIGRRVEARDYEGALEIVQGIDWRRVKSVRTLNMVADIYEASGMYQDSKRIMLLALNRASIGKTILYRLVELSIKTGEIDDAEKYFESYKKAASHDNSRYILQYKIYRAKGMPIESQIELLEEYKDREYTERWAYELAKLYSKAKMKERCIQECDDLILWFSDGKYVMKAMELKMKYTKLSPSQQQNYERQKAAQGSMGKVQMPQEVKTAVEAAKAESAVTAEETSAGWSNKEAVENEILNSSLQPGSHVQVNPAMMGKTVNIQEELVKNIRDVFSNMKEPIISEAAAEVVTSAQPKESETENIQNNLEVKELEPERLDAQVENFQPGKPTTYIPEPPVVQAKETVADATINLQGIANLRSAIHARAEEETQNILDTQEELVTESEEISVESVQEEVPTDEVSSEEAVQEEPIDPEILKAAFEPGASVIDLTGLEDVAEDTEMVSESGETEGAVEAPEIQEVHESEEKSEEVQTKEEIKEQPEEEKVHSETEEKKLQTLTGLLEKPERMSVEEVLREETPEEKRMRILNDTRPERLTEDQRKQFSYFAKVPGMDQQILDAMHGVYDYAGEKTSKRGNIAIMGGHGTGKSKLSDSLVRAICKDLGLTATKMARLDASDMNAKDPAMIVSKLAGGFLLIERAGLLNASTIAKLSQALEFRTDGLTVIIEDEKSSMRTLLNNNPEFAEKFATLISIPVFTNDELVTFARTYAKEMGYKMDEMGVLALYTLIGDNQKESEPITIGQVKDMVDRAIKRSKRFGRKFGKKKTDDENRIILYEKDFDF